LGVVLIILGIAGSMTYSLEREVTLGLQQSLDIGDYRVQFNGLRGTQQPTHFRVEGSFRVYHREADMGQLQPALKFFPTQQSPIGRAVHRSTLGEDIYLILSGFSEIDRNQATLRVLVRPLVVWIWIGGMVIALGTLICILPLGKTRSEEA
jgi:cytochrome c-type biogenesis protein CcmF